MAENTPSKPLSPTQLAITNFEKKVNNSFTQQQIKRSLGENAGTFTTSLVEIFTTDKQLQSCEPGKVVMEAIRAAALHLPISKALGYAYLTVFNNWDPVARKKIPTPTFMIGYKGLIQLAIRSGQYHIINADICFEGMLKGHNRLTGQIDLTGEPSSDTIVGYFAHFELNNGYTKTLYMSIEDMAKYALRYSPSFKRNTEKNPLPSVEELTNLAQEQYSKGENGKQGWEGNFNDMALKTVLRRLLSKYGLLSIEMQNVIANEAKVIEDADAEEIRDNVNSEKKPTFDAAKYAEDVEAQEVTEDNNANPFQ